MTFDKKITLQKKTIIDTDSDGYISEKWTDVGKVWAHVTGTPKKEVFENYAAGIVDTVTFAVRFSPITSAISPLAYRIDFKGRIYDIISVDNFGYKNQTLSFHAIGGKNNG